MHCVFSGLSLVIDFKSCDRTSGVSGCLLTLYQMFWEAGHGELGACLPSGGSGFVLDSVKSLGISLTLRLFLSFVQTVSSRS